MRCAICDYCPDTPASPAFDAVDITYQTRRIIFSETHQEFQCTSCASEIAEVVGLCPEHTK